MENTKSKAQREFDVLNKLGDGFAVAPFRHK